MKDFFKDEDKVFDEKFGNVFDQANKTVKSAFKASILTVVVWGLVVLGGLAGVIWFLVWLVSRFL